MPSALHEALVHLFQANPGAAARLLREVLGLSLPRYSEAHVESASFSELAPAEHRADSVTVLRNPAPVLAIATEVQLLKKGIKPRSWLGYTSGLMRRFNCDACVLVVTPSPAVARWAARPLRFGFGSVFTPVVLGPASIPRVTDPNEARKFPELSVLSAIAHARDDVDLAVEVASASLDGIRHLENGVLYFDLIKASLSDAARKALEMLPEHYEFQDEALRRSAQAGLEQGKAEGIQLGKAEGKAEDVIAVLEARGVPLGREQRRRILATTDLHVLDQWLRKAAVIAAADELFA